jgi:hypothetical protein
MFEANLMSSESKISYSVGYEFFKSYITWFPNDLTSKSFLNFFMFVFIYAHILSFLFVCICCVVFILGH